jgi:exosome complex component RRP45
MTREAELSTNEREFTLQVLRNGMRIDGRARDAFRPIDLTFGDEYGAVDLRLGKTQYAPKSPSRQS